MIKFLVKTLRSFKIRRKKFVVHNKNWNLNIKINVSRNISFFIMKFGSNFKTNFKYFNRCLEEDFVVLVVDFHSEEWVKKKVHKVKEKLTIKPYMNY